MKIFILSLSWIALIVVGEESNLNYENGFDGREAPTLKPIDYSNAIYQPRFAQNPTSFRYKQQNTDHVPKVPAEKENIRHYFRVRKPIARRKIFHIQKESEGNIPLAESDQVINGTVIKTNSTPEEYLIKNDMAQDKHDDYILDKLPELFEFRQESIILPLMQDTNNVKIAAGDVTEATMTVLNDMVSPQESLLSIDVRPNTQNNEKSPESDNEEETDNNSWLKLEKNAENTELLHIEEPNVDNPTMMVTKYNYLETTTKASSSPLIEILLLSDGGLKWEMNDTVDNVPKLLVEELIIVPDPSPSSIIDGRVTEASGPPKSEMVLKESEDKIVLYDQSTVNSIKQTNRSIEPNDIILSPVVTETSEPSTEMRLGGIKGHLLTNLSTQTDSKMNITLISNDGNKNVKSPRRRLRRRKLKKNKTLNIKPGKVEDLNTNDSIPIQKDDASTISTDIPITDLTTTPTTTLFQRLGDYYNTKVQTSTPRSRFTSYRDTKQTFRGRHGNHRISNPIEETQKQISVPSSENVLYRTTTTSPFRQYRAKTKFRKWNRNRNITPTVINPHVDVPKPPLVSELPTNITGYVENVSSLSKTLEENHVKANHSTTINNDNPKTVTTIEISQSNHTSSSPRRMRYRNKLRHIRTSTQPTTVTSSTSATVEVISTTSTLENDENVTSGNQSTGKSKRPPPPPPTLSPWYDGFGK
ncbi:unnamed protein product [Pieris macdunnoughi]|uniref:Uncharacterized protein n=1 Tax=Pieris macdunnoughi TaxID=345717 RepID=A0A821N231_9NEOP|nr:unnamed protein product [Pieris macdunnoughi]